MANTSYSAKEVVVVYGILPLLGEGDGDEFVNIEYLGEGTSVAVGARGHSVMVDDHNESARITVRLSALGEGRNTLSALVLHHSQGNPGLPLGIRSRTTGEVLASGFAKLAKKPDPAFGSGAPSREVQFLANELKYVIQPDV